MRVDPGPFPAGGLHLLVIDEAQDLYRPRRAAGMLWSAMKSLAAGSEGDPNPKQLRILLALMYGTRPSGMSQPLPADQVQRPADWQDLAQLGDAAGQKNLPKPGSAKPDASPLHSPLVAPMDFGEAHSITMYKREHQQAPRLFQALREAEFQELVGKFKGRFHSDAFQPQLQLFQILYRVTSGLVGGQI